MDPLIKNTSMAGRADRAAIEAAIAEAEEALKGSDKAAIEAAAAKLTEVTGTVAQKMYAAQASQAESGAGGGNAQSESASADDVVDAEFEEVKDDKK